jgi:hypothetical protein
MTAAGESWRECDTGKAMPSLLHPAAAGRMGIGWANEELWLRRSSCFYVEVPESGRYGGKVIL